MHARPTYRPTPSELVAGRGLLVLKLDALGSQIDLPTTVRAALALILGLGEGLALGHDEGLVGLVGVVIGLVSVV